MTPDMTPERWRQVKAVVQEALEVSLAERDTLLARACGSDKELRREAESLLAAADESGDTLEAPAMPLTVEGHGRARGGQLLIERLRAAVADRYVIERELGRGGMATVFLAHDLRHERPVALKVLSPELAAVIGADRFVSEIRITANLQHPHLLPLFDSGDADGLLYYTMPFVEGESLRARLLRDGQLPIDEAVRIAIAVAGALHYAHRRGVIHRDLKPENVLLLDGQAVVADFGIALAVAKAGGDRVTETGISLGTPHYMSPEQATGERQLDSRSDVYSLGCVLYEMLTGEVPHRGSSMQAVIARLLTEAPTNVRALRPRVPDHVAVAVMTALDRLPVDRWQSAGAFAAALDLHADGPGQLPSTAPATDAHGSDNLTRQLSTVRRPGWTSRWPTPTTVATVAGGLLLLAVAGTFLRLRPAARAEPSSSVAAPLVERRVAVAPFENQTRDSALAPLGPLTSDWITQGLAEAGFAEAVDPGTIRFAWQAAPNARALAMATGARLVVSGTYYLEGDSVRFLARITDGVEGKLLRSVGPVSAPAVSARHAIADLRDRVLGSVGGLLDVRGGSWATTSTLPPSLAAHERWSAGLEHNYQGDFKEAAADFMAAARLDTTWALPVVLAGAAYANGGDNAPADSLFQVADRMRERLTPSDRYLLDLRRADLRGDYASALRAGREMARLAPGSAIAEILLAADAERVNRPREAVDALTRLDPERPPVPQYPRYWRFLTIAQHLLGDYKEELTSAARGRKRHPDNLNMLYFEARALAALGRIHDVRRRLDEATDLPATTERTPGDLMREVGVELRAHAQLAAADTAFARGVRWYVENAPAAQATAANRAALGATLYAAGRWEAARRQYEQLAAEQRRGSVDVARREQQLNTEQPGDDPLFLGALGVLAARRGDRAAALAADRALAALRGPYLAGRPTYWRARIAALLGERERALALLRDALHEGRTYIELHGEADFAPLQDMPEFQELLRIKG